MAKNSPADVIDAYRRRQERRSPFTFADVSKALLFLFMLAMAAAEVAVGLALILLLYRQSRTLDADAADRMKG